MVGSALKWIAPVRIENKYGGHVFADGAVSKTVVSLSKVAGFAILFTFYGWLAWYFYRTKKKQGEVRVYF